jgi:ATP-dependent Clp protease ATP-binding subunit ClpA/ActR/RegA family two-component response regulator
LNESPLNLVERLSAKIVGHDDAVQTIASFVQLHQAGLAPHGRPVGVFLLLGPTGTGKTYTAEAFAEILHGDAKAVLRVDCGEYQSDHEVAKLIGAPPGYLGHRETRPGLTSERLHSITSSSSELSIVLFDEIEKAAPALTTLLLSLLDRGTIRLGDNTQVDFEKSLIFLTSNLGAQAMMKEVQPGLGFASTRQDRTSAELNSRLNTIGLAAVRRRFSPEFVNRIDGVLTYFPLESTAFDSILDRLILELQERIDERLGEESFTLDVSEGARKRLLSWGTSAEYGAREVKRVIHRELYRPLAAMITDDRIARASRVHVCVHDGEQGLAFHVERGRRRKRTIAAKRQGKVLVVGDSSRSMRWLESVLRQAGLGSVPAGSFKEAQLAASKSGCTRAIIDLLLPDGDDGLELALDLRGRQRDLKVTLMASDQISRAQESICRRNDISVLRKPFLAQEAIHVLTAPHTPWPTPSFSRL